MMLKDYQWYWIKYSGGQPMPAKYLYSSRSFVGMNGNYHELHEVLIGPEINLDQDARWFQAVETLVEVK